MTHPLQPIRLSMNNYLLAFRQAHALVWRRAGWYAVILVILLLLAGVTANEVIFAITGAMAWASVWW